jgi:hypothetical protein
MDLEGIGTVIAVLGAFAGAGWALYQWRDSLTQRRLDFRWKQAEAAHHLMDRVFEDPPTGFALEMIDGERDEFEIGPDKRIRVDTQVIRRALHINGDQDGAGRFIRHCFDSLLYNLERLEHSINVGLVEFSDVSTPTSYYVRLLGSYRQELVPYAEKIGFTRALRFLRRFTEWEGDR